MQYWLKNHWPGFVQTPSQQWMTKALPVFMHTTVFRILQSWINNCFVAKWFVCMRTSAWRRIILLGAKWVKMPLLLLLSDLWYDMGGVLFDIGAPIFRLPIWYRRCPIWYKTSRLLYQMCYLLVWHPIYTLKSCSIDSGIWLIWLPITSWPCGNIILRHVHSPLFPAQYLLV